MDTYTGISNDNSLYPAPPILRVTCSQQDSWKSFWGPEISCTSDPSNTQFPNVGITSSLVPAHQVGPLTDSFKCTIFSKHIYDYDVEYKCNVNPLAIASRCVYNTSIWLSNILSPVAELDLLLPSSRNVIGSSEFRCDQLRQVLNCPDLTLNSSFYENTYETSWQAKPLKCYLSFSMFGRDDREADDAIVADLDVSSVSSSVANVTATAMGMSSDGIASGVGYEWFFLCVLIFIVAGAVGNVLVCLAVILDRKLQNVTNYFLFSLAIADLLVSLVVMPLGAIPSFIGE